MFIIYSTPINGIVKMNLSLKPKVGFDWISSFRRQKTNKILHIKTKFSLGLVTWDLLIEADHSLSIHMCHYKPLQRQHCYTNWSPTRLKSLVAKKTIALLNTRLVLALLSWAQLAVFTGTWTFSVNTSDLLSGDLDRWLMERIFTYLAALFTRLMFCLHAIFMIYWLVTLKRDKMYYLFLLLLVALLVETIITVGFRKGHEYSW